MHDQASTGTVPAGQDPDPVASALLQSVPSGAFALAGLAVGLLLVAWLFIYFFVFIARGSVG